MHVLCQWFPNFPDRAPFVGPGLSARTTLLQENSIFQILFDQKCGKPELTQFRHEQIVFVAIFKANKYTKI